MNNVTRCWNATKTPHYRFSTVRVNHLVEATKKNHLVEAKKIT